MTMKISERNMLAPTWPLFLALLAISGCGGRAVVPASYNTFNSKDGSFQIQYPAEWTADSGDRSGYAWAKFTSGSAEIMVDANVAGSLIGDIAKTGILPIGIAGNAADRTPVAAAHENERESFEETANVTEQKPTTLHTGLGDARKSEFTGKKTFGGSIHGYRVTCLSPNKRISVVCQCSESEWETLKPAFDKIIQSATLGKPQPF
jgi:hypothetical protein